MSFSQLSVTADLVNWDDIQEKDDWNGFVALTIYHSLLNNLLTLQEILSFLGILPEQVINI
jgi:hypothetical protein